MARSRRANADKVGSAEAASILGIGNTFLMELARDGRLPGRKIKTKHGPPPRTYWQFKRADVVQLKARGVRRNRRQRPARARVLWKRYFGAVPAGFRPAFADNNPKNVAASNLHLIALEKAPAPAPAVRRGAWTDEMLAVLNREYPMAQNRNLAKQLGVTPTALRGMAIRHGLKKSPDFVQRTAVGLPIGTERVQLPEDFIWIKVSDTGAFRQKWRLKHHVEWEKASGQPLPPKHRVIFDDGNRRNFAPSNLKAYSINEASARTQIRYHTAPKPIRKLQRIAIAIQKQADQKLFGSKRRAPKSNRASIRKSVSGARKGEFRPRWTPEMDAILEREWPRKLRWEVAAQIGVTVCGAFARAKKLSIQRLPETRIAEARARSQMSA